MSQTRFQPQAVDLVRRCLDYNTETRITAEQALAHPYLSDWAGSGDESTGTPYIPVYDYQDLSVAQWKQHIWQELHSED